MRHTCNVRCTPSICDVAFTRYFSRTRGTLQESWYYEMVEDLNACAVSGGEWAYCWND
jgi:hypothetical protein